MKRSLLKASVCHVSVKKRKGENTESLIKRFKKQVSKTGVTKEYRDRMYFEKPSDRRRRKKAQMIRNVRKEEQKAKEREERFLKIKQKRKRKEHKKRYERSRNESDNR